MPCSLALIFAAYLESDILIVDEVLAVGDAGFQRKCLGRMESVANEGRTILLLATIWVLSLSYAHALFCLTADARLLMDRYRKSSISIREYHLQASIFATQLH